MNLYLIPYSNSLDMYIPEFWANESLAILTENMVAGNLVHRDFSSVLANYGDVVNTRKPAEFEAKRKTNTDDVTDQDASATNVQVALNQHFHVSFMIRDGEESMSLKNLSDEFIRPAMIAQARSIDKIILGQAPRFLANSAGRLGTALTIDSLVDADMIMNENKAYMSGRNMMLTAKSQADLLKIAAFTNADQVGDNGQAMREAWLGRKFGFNLFMAQNSARVVTGNTTVTGAVNLVAGYAAGTTTMTIDGFSAALGVNSWFTVAGDDTPQRIISTVGGATPTSVTFYPGLKRAVVNDAVITVYTPGQVNLVAGYAAGYAKEIVVDTFSVAPQVGQLVTFGVSTSNDPNTNPVYTIIGVTGTTGITLDRPLVVGISNDDKVNIGPAGNYNFAFHRNAIALVNRPLALPAPGTGARAANVMANNIGVRVVITYDGKAQGTRVTIDQLCGVAVLDTALGMILYG